MLLCCYAASCPQLRATDVAAPAASLGRLRSWLSLISPHSQSTIPDLVSPHPLHVGVSSAAPADATTAASTTVISESGAYGCSCGFGLITLRR
jgi:hypothetical protein